MSSGLDSDSTQIFFNDLDLTRTRTLETRAWTRTRGIVTRLQHWYRPAPFHLHPSIANGDLLVVERDCYSNVIGVDKSCHSNMSDQWGSIRPLRDICVKMIQSKKKKDFKTFCTSNEKKNFNQKKKCSIKKKKNSIKEK